VSATVCEHPELTRYSDEPRQRLPSTHLGLRGRHGPQGTL